MLEQNIPVSWHRCPETGELKARRATVDIQPDMLISFCEFLHSAQASYERRLSDVSGKQSKL